MANPQADNGHTDINHETMAILIAYPFTKQELKVILFVLRQTWGWKKKEDLISNGQIAKATKIARRHVIETVNSLVTKKVLLVTKKVLGKVRLNSIRLNKDHDTWTSAETVTSDRNSTGVVTKSVPKVVPKQSPTKEKKETIQKKPGNDCNLAIAKFAVINPHYEVLFKNKTQRDAVERMLKIHGIEVIERAITAANQALGVAYMPQITTPLQLERDWARLAANWKRENKPKIAELAKEI